jgi:hypothetical protein
LDWLSLNIDVISSLFKHLINSVQLLADGRSLLEIFAFNKERKQEKKKKLLPFSFLLLAAVLPSKIQRDWYASFIHNSRIKSKHEAQRHFFFFFFFHPTSISRVEEKRELIDKRKSFNIKTAFSIWNHDNFNNSIK